MNPVKRTFVKFYFLINRIVSSFIYFFEPIEKKIKYNGFILKYSKGTSIVNPTQQGSASIFESEISNHLIKSLSHKKQPVYIDVGANLGLISLNIIPEVPGLKIFAFEPGPHQYNLFSKTIMINNLQEIIKLYNFAIGNHNGVEDFTVHSTVHCSGDGFLDTGRAGQYKTIKVKTITLDNWWADNSEINIDAIKIDVEGAEFWVLEGAKKIISKCSPFIIMELYKNNLTKYPFTENNILDFFSLQNYSVFDAYTNNQITKKNIHLCINDLKDIYAVPNL